MSSCCVYLYIRPKTYGANLVYIQSNFLIAFARWLQEFAIACFGWGGGGSTPNLPFPWGSGTTMWQCVLGPHKCACQMASISIEQDWRQTDQLQRKGYLYRIPVYSGNFS